MDTHANPQRPHTPSDSAVVVENLCVVRGQHRIVDNVTLSLPRGRCTAILGPNGCGKTTLTRAMVGLTFITEGSVTVLGQTLGECDVRALRRRVGIVNPSTETSAGHVIGSPGTVDAELSALEAVLTGFFGTIGLYDTPTTEQRDRALDMLTHVGLSHRIDLRFGLLSTGEQRRCMIARALASGPELLILDEPTAGLDLAGREQVLATVERILASPNPPTVVMVTHHVEELSPRTVQVLLMKNGKILHRGTPEQTITPETLTQTFGCKVFVKKIHGRYWLEVLPEAWLDLIVRKPGER